MDSFTLSAGVPMWAADQVPHVCLRHIFPKMYPNAFPIPPLHRKSCKVWKPSLVAKHSCRGWIFQDPSKRSLTLKGQENVWWERREGKRWWQSHSGTIPCRGIAQLKVWACFSHYCASPTLHYKKKLKPLLFKYPPHDELHYPSYFQGFLS